jgi:hypothetical protein
LIFHHSDIREVLISLKVCAPESFWLVSLLLLRRERRRRRADAALNQRRPARRVPERRL